MTSKRFSKFTFSIMAVVLSMILFGCTITVLSVFQPETGYANSLVVTSIKVGGGTDFGSGNYTLSVLVPEDWNIEGNEVTYRFNKTGAYGHVTYNSTNSNTIETNDPAPEGYIWWSGVSENHYSTADVVTAWVQFNTGSALGEYSIDYRIGDTTDNNLSEHINNDNIINIQENPVNPTLADENKFAFWGDNPWNQQSFEITYFDPTSTNPSSTELIVDGTSYDMQLIAGYNYNGIYSYVFDAMQPGTSDYYYLFNGTTRYPETGYLTTLPVADIEYLVGAGTFTFEPSSTYNDEWTISGTSPSWEIAIPAGLEDDPTSAYVGNYAFGTDLTVDGLCNLEESSDVFSPYIDARELDNVVLDFYYQNHTNTNSHAYVAIDIEGQITELDFLLDNTGSNWQYFAQEITNFVSNKVFRIKFSFKNQDEMVSGFTIDDVRISEDLISSPIITTVQDYVVAHKGEQAIMPFTVMNNGSIAGDFTLDIDNDIEFDYDLEVYMNSVWSAVSMNQIHLDVNESKEIRILANIPEGTQLKQEVITFSVESDSNVNREQEFKFIVIATSAGTDYYGHNLLTSRNSSGPTFDWIDVTSASPLAYSQFTSGSARNLGFTFNYFGTSYNQIYLTRYGVISLVDSYDYLEEEVVPYEDETNGLISLNFSLINPNSPGQLYEESTIIDGLNAYVLTFEQTKFYSHDMSSYTAQIILFENGEIKMQYLDVPEVMPYGYSVGIENQDGSDGVNFQQSYNFLENDLAILYSDRLVAENPMPNNQTVLVDTDLTWDNNATFSTIKVYLRNGDGMFSESDIIYDGVQINTLPNSALGDLIGQSQYYWKIKGFTQDNESLWSKEFIFYTNESYTGSGTVTDSYTNEPIAGVLVSLMDGEGEGGGEFKSREAISTTTDENGYWEFVLPSEGYYLTFAKAGYEFREWVYMGLWEDTTIDVQLDLSMAHTPSPANGTRNVDLNETFSWINPAGYNHCLVELSENSDMSEATEVYNSNIINSINSMPNLEEGSFYFWRVTLSEDGINNISEGNVWYFVSQYPESIPVPDYDITISDMNISHATRTNTGYALAGTLDNNNHAFITIDNHGNIEENHIISTATSYFRKAIQLSSGNYLIGRWETTSYINGERTGLTEITPQGAVVWSQAYKYSTISSVSNEQVHDMIIDNQGKAVLAGATGFNDWDFLLTKAGMDESEPIFQHTYGVNGAQEQCNSVIQTSDGGYLMTGYKAGTATSPIGNSRFWVVKTNSNGTMEWDYEEGFGSGSNGFSAYGKMAVETSNGNFAITGLAHDNTNQAYPNNTVLVMLNAYGRKLWDKTYPLSFYGGGSSIAIANDGGFLIGGIPELLKTDAEGNLLWVYDDADNNITWNITSVVASPGAIMIADADRVIIFGDLAITVDSPENIVITKNINSDFVISWDATPGALSYKIETSETPNFSNITTTTTTETSWTDTNSSVKKFYRIIAVK